MYIIGKLHHPNDYVDAWYLTSYAIEITQEFRERVLLLSGRGKSARGKHQEELDYRLIALNWSFTPAPFENHPAPTEYAQQLIQRHREQIECPLLHVTRDYFWFTAFPRRAGDYNEIRTDDIPVKLVVETKPIHLVV